ncbi:hypothetical protein D3C75_898990 [compost metagenome]
MKTIGAASQAGMKIALGGLIAKHPPFVTKAAERHVILTNAVFRSRNLVYRVDLCMTVLQAHWAKQVFILQRVQDEWISLSCK